MTKQFNIEIRDIGAIRPYENNPRLNDDAVEAVAASLKEFGFRQPIVVDSDGVIVCGQKGQRYKGPPTRIEWVADKIVLPVIEGSPCSGAVISSCGMKGSDIRGQNYARCDGRLVRPQLVMLDDPQTTESAWSPSQSQRREAILAGDVLGMAGPGKKISGLMACTVIRPGDMADNILDRQKHPKWQGERTKMLYAFPTNEKLWAQYAQIRADSLRNDGDGSEATAFYRQNRQAMDAGALAAWPQRHNKDAVRLITS